MNSEQGSNKVEATKDHCAYCFDVIQAALNGEASSKSFPPLPSTIKDISTPLFVTWHINKDELRGCIGTFASQSIAKNLPKYAYISAFQDDRFDPISKKEVPNLICDVSLLVNFEKGKDAFDWEVGVHGIEIDLDWKNRSYGATFLPEVAAEENWTKEETLKHLLRKADCKGYSGALKDVQDHIKLERYQSSKCRLSYQEYVEYKIDSNSYRMSTAETLDNIKLNVRSARQHAYLGFYDESMKSFNKALEAIRRHYKGQDDQMLVNEWKNVERDLYTEMSVVHDLKNTVQGVKSEQSKQPPPGGNNYDNAPRDRGFNDRGYNDRGFNDRNERAPSDRPLNNRGGSAGDDDDNHDQNAKRFPYDQKPFSHHSKPPEMIDEENKNPPDKPHYIYVKPAQPKKDIQKDPDVWDPPSPKDNKKKVQPPAKKPEPKKSRASNPSNPAPQGDQQDRRNYNKPWQVPPKPQTANNENKDGDRKSFLNHCYPDGKGPDAELIQMLEKEVVDQNPNVKFEDIASLEQAKQILQEAVLLPLLCPELFIGIRRPWSGVLMFGPPGTGKTLLAKAVATQGKTTFFNITASSLASKWRGESERLVRILFEIARFYAPTTIFFDEIDALGSKRGGSGEHETSRRVLSELLIQMDGMNSVNSANANEQANDEQKKTITVIGATNRPWDLDEALRRRLEKRIYIPLPNAHGRTELFQINLKGIKLSDNVNFENLVKGTEGYSGADIASVCREASMMPIRKKLLQGGGILNQLNDIEKLKSEMDVPITQDDFTNALKNVHKSVSNTDLDNYVKWMAEFGSS